MRGRLPAVRLRSALGEIPAYRPGRRPGPGQDLARLASNETPYPPLPSVLAAIAAAAGTANRYPDPSAGALTEAIAARYELSADSVAVGCGSVALIQQLLVATADAGSEVVFGWRSFEVYPVFTKLAGAIAVPVPLRREALDLAAMADAVTPSTRLVLLCSPNNPTGTALPADEVKIFLDAIDDGILVVVDEAYFEFVTDPAAVNGLDLLSRPNVAVLRTFSKAYGLAGLRVGYCLAAAPVIAAVRQVQIPFAVSSVAQAGAIASLGATAELTTRVAGLVAERRRIIAELRRLGFWLPDSEGNFVWLPLAADSQRASDIFEAHGVLVRCFPDDGLRITVGSVADNGRLLAAATVLAGESAGGT